MRDKEKKTDDTPRCSECGKPLTKENESNDGGVCKECYYSDSHDK